MFIQNNQKIWIGLLFIHGVVISTPSKYWLSEPFFFVPASGSSTCLRAKQSAAATANMSTNICASANEKMLIFTCCQFWPVILKSRFWNEDKMKTSKLIEKNINFGIDIGCLHQHLCVLGILRCIISSFKVNFSVWIILFKNLDKKWKLEISTCLYFLITDNPQPPPPSGPPLQSQLLRSFLD